MPATPFPLSSKPVHIVLLIGLLALLVSGTWWWSGNGEDQERQTPIDGVTDGRVFEGDDRSSKSRTRQDALPKHPRVVVISVDGLGSYAVDPEQMPVLSSLLDEGAGTLNARTAFERTVTLPNHTGMVTGRRIAAAADGHGVTWNVDSPRNVRPGVPSVFSVIRESGGSSAVFTGKTKLQIWDRSWPGTMDQFLVDESLADLASSVVEDLTTVRRELVFFHIALTDTTGHEFGWDSPKYDAAVSKADDAIAQVVDVINADPKRAAQTILVVTADHGGLPGTRNHTDATALENFQIPFVVWGRGVAAEDIYVLNPDYADPGDLRPDYDGAQPVRNAAVANLVTDLLGLEPVPGSQVGVSHDLDVR